MTAFLRRICSLKFPPFWSGTNTSLLYVCLLLAFGPMRSSAQDAILLNEHIVQPEVRHFARPEMPPVDAHGDLNLSIPVLTVPGRGMDFEITFSYRSGITFSQRASWIGLGWSFDPGSITREPEGAASHTSVDKPYGVDLFDASSAPAAQPDAYYLTIPGRGTVSVTQVNNGAFEVDTGQDLVPAISEGDFAVTDHKPWRIEAALNSGAVSIDSMQTGTTYDDSLDSCSPSHTNVCNPKLDIQRFIVTVDDGTRYVFAQPTLSHFDTRFSPQANEVFYARQVYVSTWRLVAMLGPDVTASVPPDLTGWPNDTVDGGWIRFEYSNAMTAQDANPTFDPYEFTQVRFLERIVTPTHRAEFVSQQRETPFVPGSELASALYRKLTAVELYSRIDGDPDATKRVVLAHGEGEEGLGPWRDEGGSDVRRLRLKGFDIEGDDGSTRPGYAFEYYVAPAGEDPNVQSTYRTDDFGYYSFDFGSGSVDPDGGRVWSLKAVDYPTRGRLEVTYTNDHIADTSIPYVHADGGAATSYDASSPVKSYQGGPRVKELIRKDGMGSVDTTKFSYGDGHATGIPPQFWSSVHDHMLWRFTPSNRGKVSVVYEWVERERSDGSRVRTYYTTSGMGNPNVRTIETVFSVDYWRVEQNSVRNCGVPELEYCADVAVLQGNQHWNWGKPYKVEHIAADGQQVRVVEHELNLVPEHSTLASVWNRDGAQARVEFGASHVEEKDTYSCPSGAADCVSASHVLKHEVYTYSDATGLRTGTVVQESAQGLWRKDSTMYAYEQYPGMEARNMLSQVYSKARFGPGAVTVEKKWTTWSKGDSLWRPREEWVWTGDGSGSDADAPSDPGGAETIRTVQYAEYDVHGHVIKQIDANGTPVHFFYGDNTGNQCGGNFDNCTLSSYDGLRHAFLTGIEKGGLSVEVDYDAQWGQVKATVDASGRKRAYTYDAYGRLEQVQNDAREVVTEHAYYFTSGNPASDPSYVQTIARGGASPSQKTTEFVDGLARTVQTRVETGPEDVITATAYDALGRTYKNYRPYTMSGLGYDPNFDANAVSHYQSLDVEGSALPFSETHYKQDPLDRADRVYPPGESSVAVESDYGLDALGGITYQFTKRIDEEGDATRTYTDALGRTVAAVVDPGGIDATTRFAYDLQDNLTQVVRPENDTVAYAYDRRGQLIKRSSPDAGITRIRYDAAGNLRFEQNASQAASGEVLFTTYDPLGRPAELGVVSASFDTLDGTVSSYEAESDTAAWRHVWAYDGKPSGEAYPWNQVSIGSTSIDSTEGRLAADAYRSNGRWQVSLYSYDAEGRVKAKYVFTQGHSLLDATIRYEYDRQGRLIERSTTVGSETYAQWYAYNRRGLVEAVYASRSEKQPSLPDVTYRYAADGQVEAMEFRGLEPVTYAQTIRGWTDEIDGIRGPDELFAASYSYFADGNVDRATFRQPGLSGAPTRYRYAHTYDALGRLTGADYSYYDSGWQGTGAYDVTAGYDDNGNVQTLARYGESGSLVDDLTFTYADSVAGGNYRPNRLKQLTDAAGALHDWDAGDGTFGYDAAGRMTASPAPYSLTAADYDERHLPIALTTASGTSRYRYSAAGERYYKQVGAAPAQHYVLDEGATLGLFDASFDNLDVFVEEEQSSNTETAHTTEAVGYLVFGAPGGVDGSVGEVGTVRADQPDRSTWHAVQTGNSYATPVAFAQVASYEGQSPAHVRLRSVAGGGFEWQIEEWEYQDGAHGKETVSYAVFEAGARQLSDGTRMEVGTVSTDENWVSVTFSQPFSAVPIVLAQSQTVNGGQSAVTRIRNVTSSGFEVRMQEEEELDAAGGHAVETIGYVAIAPGAGAAGVDFEAGRTGNEVEGTDSNGDPRWHRITLAAPFPRPVVFASMQTADGGDTAAVRHRIHPLPRYWNILLPSGEVAGRIEP